MSKTCRALVAILVLHASPARADPFTLTYSYSNLLDGNLFTVLSLAQLRAATEESLGLWSRYAPINFIEVPDTGPPPSDWDYPAEGTPDIRIGHHEDAVSSHAFYPWGGAGLAQDVHMRTRHAAPFYWSFGDDPSPFAIDFMATMVHEIGHALGLGHREGEPSIMNGAQLWNYAGLGSAFLFPRDIIDIQALYGIGVGSVQPLADVASTPEPGTLVLLSLPLAALLRGRRRRCRATPADTRQPASASNDVRPLEAAIPE
jgi:hypothetical protein